MPSCATCGFESDATVKFCPECGAEPVEVALIGENTDMIDMQGDAYADLAEVLLLGRKRDEPTVALERVFDRYERKGNVVLAGHARVRLADLQTVGRQ